MGRSKMENQMNQNEVAKLVTFIEENLRASPSSSLFYRNAIDEK
jgi:hypothetical protein